MTRLRLFTNATVATLEPASGYGLIEDCALAIKDEQIAYVGPVNGLPEIFAAVEKTPLGDRLVTPGLIDCHTHLVYAGSRAREFEMRLVGASYEEIAKAGGGIFSTVRATRNASEQELLDSALKRLDRLLSEGVTTVEIKSGYGLDRDTELRMLRVAARLERERPVRIVKTFLGAHAIPHDMSGDEYIDNICLPTLREAAAEGLVDMVDGFCEGIAFSPAQIEKVFIAAKEIGIPVKLHAEQLSNLNGAALAARYNACSADHLEYVDDAGVHAMAKAGMVAVMLPGAFYFLRESKLPPIDAFRKANIPMAVATDSNPGSAPMTSILLAMNMAATLFGLTPQECLRGTTTNAAKALNLSEIGVLANGMRADLAIWDVAHPAELTYRMGDAPLYQRIFGGHEC